MKRLLRERSRLVAGAVMLVAAVVVLGVAYASVANKIIVSTQMPYLLGGGVGALLCAGVGMVLLRSQEDLDTRGRLVSLEAAHEAMSDRFEALGVQVEYVTQLLEAIVQDDSGPPPVRPDRVGGEVRI